MLSNFSLKSFRDCLRPFITLSHTTQQFCLSISVKEFKSFRYRHIDRWISQCCSLERIGNISFLRLSLACSSYRFLHSLYLCWWAIGVNLDLYFRRFALQSYFFLQTHRNAMMLALGGLVTTSKPFSNSNSVRKFTIDFLNSCFSSLSIACAKFTVLL